MKLASVLCVLVMAVGCAEDNPARHLDGGDEVDAVGQVELVVAKAGNGSGTVTSTPEGISCGASCTASFLQGSVVTLTAAAADDSDFAGWTGACTGDATTCDVTLAAAADVTATFKLKTHTVTLAKAGPGTGAIHGDSVDCTDNCTLTVDHGTTLTFTGVPTGLSVFAGWGGACTGTGACTVTVTSDLSIDGNFALDNFTLFVKKSGTGAGTVTSSPAGIACGATCTYTFTANQVVTLTATPATGSTFTSWSGGGCSGAGTCVVTIDAAKTVTATFTLNQYAVTITPTGMGAVTSTPTGIDCGTTCSHNFDYNTSVTLTAVPATGWSFTGWGGACSGSATTCTLTVNAAKNVTATFAINMYPLTVTNGGNGTVSGGGINCGSTCSGSYAHGTIVSLTATPNTGYHFTGWGGACSGTGACSVTMDAAKTVTASFAINTYTLTVTNGGNGTITGGGINCGTQCTGTYNYTTTPFTLTATPATGYHFVGWTGACSGTGTCSVTMNADRSVGATFAINTYTLTVTKQGSGTGAVTGPGISCGATCSGTYNYSTTPITLTASVDQGSVFSGWSGDCSGTGSCSITMNQVHNVTATFTKTAVLTLQTSGANGATGTISDGTVMCSGTCTHTVPVGTVLTITQTPSTANATASVFIGWSVASCPGSTCAVTVNGDMTVTATYKLKPNLVFLTSQLYDGNINGIDGADKECQTLAGNKGLPGTYKAYLSYRNQYNGGIVPITTTVNAPDRFTGASGWVRVDGKPLANTIDQMHKGTLFNPPSVMEDGTTVSSQQSFAWTGTSSAGTLTSYCYSNVFPNVTGWAGYEGAGGFGDSTRTDTSVVQQDSFSCTNKVHLYCFGVDRAAVAQ